MFKKKSNLRVIVLMPSSHILAYNSIKTLIKKHRGIELVAVMRSNFSLFSKTAINKLEKHRKKVGLYYSILFLLSISFYKIRVWKSKFFGKKEIGVRQLCFANGVVLKDFDEIHQKKNILWLKKMNPDLIISIGFDQIIKKNVLDIPNIGCINVHPGLLPYYKGVMPAFWALKANAKRFGISIHWMDEGIDTGEIILKKSFKIKSHDTMQSLIEKASMISGKILIRAIGKVKNDCMKKKVFDGFVLKMTKIRRAGNLKCLKNKLPKIIEIKKSAVLIKRVGRYYSFPDRKDLKVFFAKGYKLINFRRLFKKI